MPIKAPAAGTSTSPGASLRAVTPHASNPLPDGACRSLWVGGAGTLVVRGVNDDADTTLINASGWMMIRVSHVRAASTATGIVAVY